MFQPTPKVRVTRTTELAIVVKTKLEGEKTLIESKTVVVFKGSKKAFEIWKMVHSLEGCKVDMNFVSKAKVPEKLILRKWETIPSETQASA